MPARVQCRLDASFLSCMSIAFSTPLSNFFFFFLCVCVCVCVCMCVYVCVCACICVVLVFSQVMTFLAWTTVTLVLRSTFLSSKPLPTRTFASVTLAGALSGNHHCSPVQLNIMTPFSFCKSYLFIPCITKLVHVLWPSERVCKNSTGPCKKSC